MEAPKSPFPAAKVYFWLLCLLFGRLAYSFFCPLELSGDEAYYWDWGRSLDWGYFSKPPLIAWLMAFGEQFLGGSAFALRSLAAVFGTGGLLACYLLAKSLFGERTAFFALAALVCSPANAALNLIITIDAPLVFCWSLALLSFWKLIASPSWAWKWAALLFLALGFGTLSKQMMLTFIPLAFCFLLFSAEHRKSLRNPRLYATLLLPALFLVPTLLWNARHEWITVQHTAHHFAGEFSLLKSISRLFGFLLSQAGVLSPITWALTVASLLSGAYCLRRFRPQELYLWLFSAPALLAICLLSFQRNINPNWPAVFYPAGILFTAAWATNQFSTGKLYRWRSWFKPGLYCGAALALLAYALPVLMAPLGLAGSKIDITARLGGWRSLAQEIASLRADAPTPPFILVHGHRYTASQLAFYLPDQPRTFQWQSSGSPPQSQYHLWGIPDSLRGQDALIIMDAHLASLPPDLQNAFTTIHPIGPLSIPLGPTKSRNYLLFKATHYLPSPQPK